MNRAYRNLATTAVEESLGGRHFCNRHFATHDLLQELCQKAGFADMRLGKSTTLGNGNTYANSSLGLPMYTFLQHARKRLSEDGNYNEVCKNGIILPEKCVTCVNQESAMAMSFDRLANDLFAEITRIPLIDPHSHINPLQPAAQSLDDILGYHYYTELAHSAGMPRDPLRAETPPRERVRAILSHMDRFDNTVQYQWFLAIAQVFLGFQKDHVAAEDADKLFDAAEKVMAQQDWEETVLSRSNVEKIFLTNDFDDPLEDFNTGRYVPCLRTDDLVFHLDKPAVRERLARATGVEVGDSRSLRLALDKLFEHFKQKGAKACAISLPPDFTPAAPESSFQIPSDPPDFGVISRAAFWMLAECCRDFKLPFDLMIGVNRRVYQNGVFQGQDLFDQRTSLIQYAELFNAFPDVMFPISVLSSGQNQELVSYSWIFPNVVMHGHWWYSNIPHYIAGDLRARLQAVPKSKQIGYYSDAYKLEFILPKYDMYRRILAQVLADDFVRAKLWSEKQAVAMARLLLRGNTERVFQV